MKKTLSLTVIIHTKDDEKKIKDCIQSLPDYVQEILVADMRSRDKTVTLAKQLGARVVTVQDHGVAEPERDKTLELAKTKWILVLDSDERLTPFLHRKISKIIEEDSADAVAFPRKNLMLGKWVQHGLRWPDYQKRLFKKGFVHWSSTIHETPIHSGRFVELPATEKFAIVHHHTTDIDQLLHKTIQQAAKERFYNAQKNVSALDIYHRTEQEFPWREFEHEGIKDGMHGFITNKFMQVYRFLEFAYFWERTGMKEILGKSDIETLWNKDERIKELENELTILKSSKFYKAYQLILRMKAIFSKSMN